MHIRNTMLAIALVIGVCASTTAASANKDPKDPPPDARLAAVHEKLAGIWVNNPESENSAPPPETGGFTGPRGNGGGGGGRGGGGGGRGGYGGHGGGGGYGGGGGGGFGGVGGPGGRGQANDKESEARAAALHVYERSLMDPVKQMTIVVHDETVSITYDDGRVEELQTTGKKVTEKHENGYVKVTRKTHWDVGALISDIEVSNGPNFQQRYDVTADGAQLHVSTTPVRPQNQNGGRGGYGGGYGGGNGGLGYGRTATHVYARPATTAAN